MDIAKMCPIILPTPRAQRLDVSAFSKTKRKWFDADWHSLKSQPQMNSQLLLPLVLLFATISAHALSDKELDSIGRRVWVNECGGTRDGLTSWNAGENFARPAGASAIFRSTKACAPSISRPDKSSSAQSSGNVCGSD